MCRMKKYLYVKFKSSKNNNFLISCNLYMYQLFCYKEIRPKMEDYTNNKALNQ